MKNKSNQLPPNEKELQRFIRYALRDTTAEWQATDGTHLHILSVGEWNHHEGPDFLNMALQAEGKILVGHGEVHWRSSDWEEHRHDAHPMYAELLLHIVLKENRTATPFARYTLVMPEEIVRYYAEKKPDISPHQSPSALDGILRDYARQRFVRKSEYAKAALGLYDTKTAYMRLLDDFCQRRLQKKHSPKGIRTLASFLNQSENAAIVSFLHVAENALCCAAEETLSALEKVLNESSLGKGTTVEVVVNIILPLLYAQSEIADHRSVSAAIFRYFWTLRTANKYAHLTRKFPHIPQHYLWQQQGLLEYEAETAAPAKPSSSALQPIAAHAMPEMVLTLYAL